MRTKEEIKQRIAEFEKQKTSMAQVSRLEPAKGDFNKIADGIMFLDRQIGLLNWVLKQ